jgi:hypothetical protein
MRYAQVLAALVTDQVFLHVTVCMVILLYSGLIQGYSYDISCPSCMPWTRDDDGGGDDHYDYNEIMFGKCLVQFCPDSFTPL